MPESLEGLSAGAQIQLQNADPELFQLLGNTAPAELELAAMNHQLGDAATPPADREAAQRRAEAERLIAEGAFPTPGRYEGETYIAGREGNLTQQFAVQSLAPDLYEAEMARLNTPAPLTPQQQADAQIIARYATAGAA
jgi:hypothetical protein